MRHAALTVDTVSPKVPSAPPRNAEETSMANRTPEPEPQRAPDGYPGPPRWVKVIGIVLVAILLMAAFIVVTGLGGPHGPQRHGAGSIVVADAVELGSQTAAR